LKSLLGHRLLHDLQNIVNAGKQRTEELVAVLQDAFGVLHRHHGLFELLLKTCRLLVELLIHLNLKEKFVYFGTEQVVFVL